MSQEFKDSLDNTNWMYNCTILKMMADLNSKTLVTLRDSRRKANLEGKIFKEHEEWENEGGQEQLSPGQASEAQGR